MKTVWKYPTHPDELTLNLPIGAEVIHFAMQHGKPTMWVLVNPDNPNSSYTFHVVGTGHPIENNKARHLGSCIDRVNDFVWHLFRW